MRNIPKNHMLLTVLDRDYEEREVEVPCKYEVCPECEGAGSVLTESLRGYAISAEEWNGPDWDDDSREAYMSGGYDVPCPECAGRTTVAVPDLRGFRLSLWKDWRRKVRSDNEARRERAWQQQLRDRGIEY